MSTALWVQGWIVSDDPAAAVASVLGPAKPPAAVTPGPGWTVEDPLDPDEPVGRIRSLVLVGADTACRSELVPGSQGHPPPPSGAARAVRSVELGPGRTLVLDGRCWYRIPDPSRVRVQVIFRDPGRTLA